MTQQEFFTYKGFPLVRKDNVIYYGNMSDKFVAMLTILSTHKVKDLEVADKTRVQLMHTDPTVPVTELITKTSERGSLYEALDVASIWLEKNN
ncbi:MAG: hypothetical protein E7490_09530 [Ruminococcaceae bacterium]|nr:hypothetical protein [Oscillospiraceae bacterium]